jgi:serine/threonine-protein kinase HipA
MLPEKIPLLEVAIRKYQGSYQAVVELLKQLQLPGENLRRFFEQVAFSVMVRNGDAHLKNFGLLYRSATDAWLAPMYDVVTTTIYRYTRYEGGPELEDKTMALKLLRGRHQTRAYPTREELMAFGRRVCGVANPEATVHNIAQAMSETLRQAKTDERIAPPLRSAISTAWEAGIEQAMSA